MCATVQPRWQVQPVPTPVDCLLPYVPHVGKDMEGITERYHFHFMATITNENRDARIS